jgi:2'-hydroxyisoflavone reductase
MTTKRRDFLKGSLAAAALVACGKNSNGTSPIVTPEPEPEPVAPDPEPTVGKKLLILGGTGFIGPHIVDAAVAANHTVTLFNRGKTNPHLFPDLEKLRGDRDGDLSALEGRKWDAVIDTSGYVPRIVGMSAQLLADSVEQYIFISTVSVYAEFSTVGMDESGPIATIEDETSEEVNKYYGALKALSEQAAEKAMPGRVANVRPGLIVGPRDPTGRFTYWPNRMKRGGEVLAPGTGDDPIQYIDARDLATWLVHIIAKRHVGVYNALGPNDAPSMKSLLDDCRTAAGTDATVTWVDAAFLENQKVAAWMDMPAWIPPEGEYAGFGKMNVSKAAAAGLTFRPALETARDTLAWLDTLDAGERAKVTGAGLSAEREAEVLKAWKARGV